MFTHNLHLAPYYSLCLKLSPVFKGECKRKDKLPDKGTVPLYFVLYYTLNMSGEIHGKK